MLSLAVDLVVVYMMKDVRKIRWFGFEVDLSSNGLTWAVIPIFLKTYVNKKIVEVIIDYQTCHTRIRPRFLPSADKGYI